MLPMFEKITAARDVLYSLARYCRLSSPQLDRLFEQEGVYPDKQAWKAFLQYFLLSLAAVLMVSGVVFFFAYNWADMHKFVKLGLLQGLLLLVLGLLLFGRFDRRIKTVLFTAAAMLVGVLFAVFGQIYQTGANAYDFFLGWTMAILLWTLAGRTAYLWLLFLVLVNLTLFFYVQQVAAKWPDFLLPMLLFLINASAVAVWEYLWSRKIIDAGSRWLPTILGLAAIVCNTIGVCVAIFNDFKNDWGVTLLLTLLVYGAALSYGYWSRRLFYPAALWLSAIVIATTFIIRLFVHSKSPGEGMFLLASIFVIGSTTFLAKHLVRLNKNWHGNY